MYYSSKIYSKDSGMVSRNRLDNKDIIIDEILGELYWGVKNNIAYDTIDNNNDFIKLLMQFDEELYSDVQDTDWYRDTIRKNLEKLNEVSLIFLLNCLTAMESY